MNIRQTRKTASFALASRCLGHLGALGLALLTAVGSAAEARKPASNYNVLFIIADDLNCDLGIYGHPQVKTPNIDRLASRGLRFEHAFCQYPLCGPTRASFMTGFYPDQTLIHANSIRIRQCLPEVQTLSQMFINAGSTAARIGKIYHYNVPTDIGTPGHDDPASWNLTVNPKGRDKAEERKIFSLMRWQFSATLSWLAAEGEDKEQTDGIGATEAVRLLEGFSKDKTPFFLAVGFYRPHTPFVAPKAYFDLYPPDAIPVPEVPEGYLDTLPAPARAILTSKKEQLNLPLETARQAIQAYHASISFMDAQVGRVLEGLDRAGLADSTIVVFTSDHGYHMGEHGHYQKRTLFDNGSRVPLIISVPGMKTAGQATAAPAEMIDFYPTLAELCGLSAPPNLPGVSLAPVLKDVGARPREAALTQLENGYSIRTERHRYTEWGPDGSEGAELYDHATDPAEMNNLAGEKVHSKTVATLSAMLRERVRKAQQVPEGLKQVPGGAEPKKKKK